MSRKSMDQMVRWVQNAPQSIKRSLSTTTATGSSAKNYYNGSSSLNKQWVHPPDALSCGRVEYTVRFLGEVEVGQAKGTEVIKEAIQKLRFNFQVRKSVNGTSGSKLQKVEIHISVDGVAVVDARSGVNLYKYPLHQISFCADDKQDKRIFSFIAKSSDVSNHRCFVFLSEKLAEEITLTIGEAFDLAYRKFLNNNGRDLESKKQTIFLKRRVAELEAENAVLRQRLAHFEKGIAPAEAGAAEKNGGGWESFGGSPPPKVPSTPVPPAPPSSLRSRPPPLPPPNNPTSHLSSSSSSALQQLSANGPTVGKQLENLQLDSMENIFDDDFDPRADEQKPKREPNSGSNDKDPFGLDPFLTEPSLEFQPEDSKARYSSNFGADNPSPEELESAISMIDDRLAEMRDGFERGLGTGPLDGRGAGDLLQDFHSFAKDTKQQ